ncbi:MAG: precorrin-6y C5,15-methyltransferase (decarboxylating) subunit CbiE [Streptomyces sp.]|uniref:precorrin-6y C5,15-methyltransferase (decarboxylating) subunit CbiE n=1 Tax=Streptomyces sp. TaxID=1931 RepID=UPI003D6A557B
MITVIGTGTGTGTDAGADAELQGPGRDAALAGATLVVGARRHLDAAPVPAGAERFVLGALSPALDAVEAHLAVPGAGVVVLASGDPGFFGIVRALAGRFGPAALQVLPSAPAVAVAFARAGLPWDDAAVVSAHGRDPRTALNVCRAHHKTAVLTGPGCGPAELGAALARTGIPRTLVVATALGSADEHVERLSPAEAAARVWPDPVSLVLCLDETRAVAPAQRTLAGGRSAPGRWALPETEFAHRDSMVTKYEVRALALARLGPATGDLVWDIGAGSGSVAVECARLGAAAIAVERTAEGVERVRANAAAHGVDIETVHGSAPDVLGELPDPDAVFVGGGGRQLPAIVAACARRARRCVVVTLAALDRVPEVRAALAGAGLAPDGVLLHSSRLSPLPGEVTRLSATNPVFVLWGTAPAPHPASDFPDPAEGATP